MRVQKVGNFHPVQFAEDRIASQIWAEHGVDCLGRTKKCLYIDNPVGSKTSAQCINDLSFVSAGIEFDGNSASGAPGQGGANCLPASTSIPHDRGDRIRVVIWTPHR